MWRFQICHNKLNIFFGLVRRSNLKSSHWTHFMSSTLTHEAVMLGDVGHCDVMYTLCCLYVVYPGQPTPLEQWQLLKRLRSQLEGTQADAGWSTHVMDSLIFAVYHWLPKWSLIYQSDPPDVHCRCKPAIGCVSHMALSYLSALSLLLFSKSPSLQETTTHTDLVAYTLKMPTWSKNWLVQSHIRIGGFNWNAAHSLWMGDASPNCIVVLLLPYASAVCTKSREKVTFSSGSAKTSQPTMFFKP